MARKRGRAGSQQGATLQNGVKAGNIKKGSPSVGKNSKQLQAPGVAVAAACGRDDPALSVVRSRASKVNPEKQGLGKLGERHADARASTAREPTGGDEEGDEERDGDDPMDDGVEDVDNSMRIYDDDDNDDDDDDDNDDDDDDDDDDSDSNMPDYRKRIRRKRKKADTAEPNVEEQGLAMVEENDAEVAAAGMEFPSDGKYRNKQRVLLFSSRGITSRYRHLLGDLRKLIPHHKKDVKLDTCRGESLSGAINTIAEIKSCNSCVFLECRKRTDLYMWAGKTPAGPSVKFHVLNVHTMDELKLTGNCMIGSRPLLSFDKKFDETPHWKVIKGLLMDVFNTPRGHPKSKPFIDRIMSFFVADGKIWVRNYQIVDKGDGTDSSLNKKIERSEDTLSLVEIGPRFVLNPIRVFACSFGGPTLYQNGEYVSPNTARSARKKRAGTKFEDRQQSKKIVKKKKNQPAVLPGPLDNVFDEK